MMQENGENFIPEICFENAQSGKRMHRGSFQQKNFSCSCPKV